MDKAAGAGEREGPPVRVRFAPSPTGYLHVGNMRTALTNYLFAQKEGGEFVLRIEDTDVERSDAVYEASILKDLKWLGITWDEGPFRQSERTGIYRGHVDMLLDKGLAYKCFCTKERLEQAREEALRKGEAPRYDGTCRDLPKETAEDFEKKGMPFVVRIKSARKAIRIRDLIHGDIYFPPDHVDDFILMKQEMTPSYNFAVTVDDMLMGITHVIRGADHVSNTPKQVMLFETFGRTPPRYAHHSLLTGSDHKPLSKRHGATHVREFRDMGILAPALLNYVAVIGRKVEKEIMEADELARTFTLSSLSSSDSLFDMEKLLWFNKEYIRRLPAGDLLGRLGLPARYGAEVDLLKENARTLSEIKDYLDIFDGFDVGEEGVTHLAGIEGLGGLVSLAEGLFAKDGSSLDEAVHAIRDGSGLPRKEIFMFLRVVLTGRKHGPPLKDIASLLAKETVAKRISWLKERFSLP